MRSRAIRSTPAGGSSSCRRARQRKLLRQTIEPAARRVRPRGDRAAAICSRATSGWRGSIGRCRARRRCSRRSSARCCSSARRDASGRAARACAARPFICGPASSPRAARLLRRAAAPPAHGAAVRARALRSAARRARHRSRQREPDPPDVLSRLRLSRLRARRRGERPARRARAAPARCSPRSRRCRSITSSSRVADHPAGSARAVAGGFRPARPAARRSRARRRVTDETHDAGFRERLEHELPGIEEAREPAIERARRPCSSGRRSTRHTRCVVSRDREEELRDVARADPARASRDDGVGATDATAVVFHRPLPYLYLAQQVLRRRARAVPDVRRAAARPPSRLRRCSISCSRSRAPAARARRRSRCCDRTCCSSTSTARRVGPRDAAALDARARRAARDGRGDDVSRRGRARSSAAARRAIGSSARGRARAAAAAADGARSRCGRFATARRASAQVAAICGFLSTSGTAATIAGDAWQRSPPARPRGGARRARRARRRVPAARRSRRATPRSSSARFITRSKARRSRRGAARARRASGRRRGRAVRRVRSRAPRRPRRDRLARARRAAASSTRAVCSRRSAGRRRSITTRRSRRRSAICCGSPRATRRAPRLPARGRRHRRPLADGRRRARSRRARRDAPAAGRAVFADEVLTSATIRRRRDAARSDRTSPRGWRSDRARPPLTDARTAAWSTRAPPSVVPRQPRRPLRRLSVQVLLRERARPARGARRDGRASRRSSAARSCTRSSSSSIATWQRERPRHDHDGDAARGARRCSRAIADDALARLPEADRALEETRLLGSIVARGMAERVFELEADAGGDDRRSADRVRR